MGERIFVVGSNSFSGASFVGEVVLFLLVPLTLAYCVLTEGRRGGDTQAQSAAAKRPL